jgi:hypothetical protein
MIRLVCLLALLSVMPNASAHAQQTPNPALVRADCDCPDIDVVFLMDEIIARARRKLVDVRNGRFEDVSGLPNNSTGLNRAIREAQTLRSVYLHDISRCQRVCRSHGNTNPTDPRSAFSGARAACPECTEAMLSLRTAESELSELLTEMAQFRTQNRFEAAGGETVADFSPIVERVDLARTSYERELARYEQLVDRTEELERAATRQGAAEAAEGADGHMSFPDYLGFMGGEFVEGLAAGVDLFLESARQEGIPISDQLAVSRIGDAVAARRYAEHFYLDRVKPLKDAYEAQLSRLPNPGRYRAADYGVGTFTYQDGAALDRMARYETRQARLLDARDRALDILIACNLNQCRPTPDIDGEFEPGGVYEGVAPGSNTTVDAPLIEPDNGAGLTGEGPQLGLPDQVPPVGADEKTPPNADGTSLPAPQTGYTDIPDNPGIPPEVFEALARLEAAGINPNAGPCNYPSETICHGLVEGVRDECRNRLNTLIAECRNYQSNAFTQWGRIETCRQSCEASANSVTEEYWLVEQALATIEIAYIENQFPSDDERAALEAQLANNMPRITSLQALPASRRLQIYRNTNSGALVEHAGAYFDPQPPLEYIGETGGTLTATERDQLGDLLQENIEIEALLSSANDPELDAWRTDARQSWIGGGRWPAPIACAEDAIADERQSCLAACSNQREQSAGARSICQPSGVIGRMSYPGATQQLYPPGDPRRSQ